MSSIVSVSSSMNDSRASTTSVSSSHGRNKEEARAVFEAAIARNPNDSFSYHKLGLLLEEEFKDEEGAVKCYEEAIATNSRNFPAYNSLGVALSRKRDKERALECFKRCLEIKPDYGRALKNLGLLYLHEIKDYNNARHYLQECIRVDPNNASAYCALGLLLELEFKDKRGAEQAYRAATIADEMNPIGFLRSGVLRASEKDYQGAKTCYEAALRVCPTDSSTLTKLGKLALSNLHDLRLAKACLEAAVRINPDEFKARNALTQLKKRKQAEKQQQRRERISARSVSSSIQDTDSDMASPLLSAEGAELGGTPKGPESTGSPPIAVIASREDQGYTSGDDDGNDADIESQYPFLSRTNTENESSLDCPTLAPPLTNRELKCPQGHSLILVRTKPSAYTPRATWACEECQKSIGGMELKVQGALYCQICKYDLCFQCSQRPQTAHVMPEEPVFLGSGAFGDVYKEYDFELNSYVAVKRIRRSAAGDLKREASLQQRFRGHPNIVNIFRWEEKPGSGEIRLLMELASSSVHHLIKKEGALHERQARLFIKDCLSGLVALHRGHVIHRDIKPDNLLLSVAAKEPTAKLSDFGLSKDQPQRTMMQTLGLKGTPNYLAPECFQSPPRWSPGADIWAVGCTWLTMLTGHNPWHGTVLSNAPIETFCFRMNVLMEKKGHSSPNSKRHSSIHRQTASVDPQQQQEEEEEFSSLEPIVPPFVSPTAMELLKMCFACDRSRRPTAEALLRHPYFEAAENEPKALRCGGNELEASLAQPSSASIEGEESWSAFKERIKSLKKPKAPKHHRLVGATRTPEGEAAGQQRQTSDESFQGIDSSEFYPPTGSDESAAMTFQSTNTFSGSANCTTGTGITSTETGHSEPPTLPDSDRTRMLSKNTAEEGQREPGVNAAVFPPPAPAPTSAKTVPELSTHGTEPPASSAVVEIHSSRLQANETIVNDIAPSVVRSVVVRTRRLNTAGLVAVALFICILFAFMRW